MRKNIFIAVITIVLLMAVLTSCSNKKEETVTEKQTAETKIASAVQEEISSVIDETEKQEETETVTEKETVTKKTETQKPTTQETRAPTTASVPTTVSTTAVPDVTIDFFYPTEGAVFYHDGQPQYITKEMMNNDILKIINKVTKNERFGMLKLYVDEQMTDRIKAENLCLEISFEGVHLINGLHGIDKPDGTKSQYMFNFEKVLIALDGDYKNVIFFMKDGKYQSGPIKPYNSSMSDDILAYLFD